MTIELDFKGPYPVIPTTESSSILDVPEAKVPGIYMWAVSKDGRCLINYVGISKTSIGERQREHVQAFLSGDYLVYDAAELQNGKRKQLLVPGKEDGLTKILKLHAEHPNTVLEHLKVVEIYFAEIRAKRELLERIESAIIRSLRNADATSLLDNVRLSRSVDSPDMLVQISNPERFIGLESEITV